MGIHVGIEHRTTYRFEHVVEVAPHVLRLRPAPHCRTPILAYSLTVSPGNHFINWQQDPFGNHLARIVFPEPSDHLSITVDLLADLTVINPFDFFVEESAANFPFTYDATVKADLEPYLKTSTAGGPLLDAFMADPANRLAAVEASSSEPSIAIVDFLVDLNRRLYERVEYSVRMEAGVQDPEFTLDVGIGSCRDTSWLLVEIMRRLGLAARFVSGYLLQLVSDQTALDGPSGPKEDFTDLHAWAEVYIPGAGWIGLDPTSGLFAGEGHIPLACTPHPASAAPVTGGTAPVEVEFDFSNAVHRVREDPRVTLPYSAEQWDEIDSLGGAVDARLDAGDVRLTMGGEPTFVSIDDMDGAEWSVAADSPEKRALAAILAERLLSRFTDGGLIQHGQGKWYPGEPLPRWQIGLVWRTDGHRLWHRPDLLANPNDDGEASLATALLFAEALAARFGLNADAVIGAYEDPVDLVWREARQPAGEPSELDVQPSETDALAEPETRATVIDRLTGVPGTPSGFVFPLAESADGRGWVTTSWTLRRGRLYLVPGDSPLGLRLPLDSLCWSESPPTFERSLFADNGQLPVPSLQHLTGPEGVDGAAATGQDSAPAQQRPALVDLQPAEYVEVHETQPTAVTVELRDDHLCVFLPPLQDAVRSVELLGVIEAVADELGAPIVIEGYPPPRDARLNTLVVTPDPGVIEVNIQPTSSWPELRDLMHTVYGEARLSRLGTEKFAVDGTHTGTGGGNHLTLGGARPADSPMLRRPDLLRSMITYWQHHPSLSYTFSGQFIGPTSQAPRVDEGRVDTLYELEIAFDEMSRLRDADGEEDTTTSRDLEDSEQPEDDDQAKRERLAPWTVDRLLRNMLTDLTGNTHRSEFCIDKLFSPDSERGRLGIVELRAFEMPPHPQMALVQSLLVRSLVARFWDSPYEGPLVRWGTDLYDRYLLPWFNRADIREVVADLNAHGIAFDDTWLDPFFEFRFPLIGEITLDTVRLELRRAIEPWHVLGEEVSESGTSRYVDSSIERLQVLVEGFDTGRYLLTCNGVPVPLQPTATPGTAVAGVRFKAWPPYSALHPTIKAHGPLVFDLVDLWSSRSLGGCTYHVSHPGGRSYETFPVNAAEAEARRSGRFFAHGHTPGQIDTASLERAVADSTGEYRRTLDLRRFPRPSQG